MGAPTDGAAFTAAGAAFTAATGCLKAGVGVAAAANAFVTPGAGKPDKKPTISKCPSFIATSIAKTVLPQPSSSGCVKSIPATIRSFTLLSVPALTAA
jgi:hypothetical protein